MERWEELEREGRTAASVVAVMPFLGAEGSAARIRDFRRRFPSVPFVLVTRRDLENFYHLNDFTVDDVVGVDEPSDSIWRAVLAVRRLSMLDRIAAVIRDSPAIPSRLRAALVEACASSPLFKSVAPWAEHLHCHPTTLWCHWRRARAYARAAETAQVNHGFDTLAREMALKVAAPLAVALGLICWLGQGTGLAQDLSQLLARGDTAATVAALEQYVRAEPNDAEPHYELGRLLAARASERAREYDDRLRAEQHLRHALELRPDEPRYLAVLALVFLKRGMRVDAARLIDRAIDAALADPGPGAKSGSRSGLDAVLAWPSPGGSTA